VKPFANEPVLELRRAPVRASLLEALSGLDKQLAIEVGDQAGETFVSTDPGSPERVVAVAERASAETARAAVLDAVDAAPVWSRTPAVKRALALTQAAEYLRGRRLTAAALMVRECAKPWPEADADVCEAIDFLEYYAREAVALDAGRELLQVPGERNTMRYAARGVAAVIAPWNFPLAIPCGMTAAALATGNTVVLKPAEQSPATASMLVEALRAGGVPEGAIGLVTGFGDAGEALVSDPRVHTIAFTGSSAVGLAIVRAAAETPDGQSHVKRVVAEMGGKNCVLVDADADLDDAVPAILGSAFGYAGQKCSAAARVLAHERIADALIERLGGAMRALVVGQAESFATDVPPVIEQEARERVERYSDSAARDGTLVVGGSDPPDAGWFCRPALATDLPSGSDVLSDEVFGPLLAVERVRDMAAACDVVEASPFALTGGLFSRSPATIDEVVQRSPVGNLYLNRNITGAMVGRQPFGGNRRSGIGSKAGGPDYVLQFVEPRVVSENTMRHGLVVE
jgi:RHH-type proline utilization regulon transcriptional repressor/proline dehydrogenase/delta 1-pyrroline-5-carboxylate dehydrogenase